MTYVRETCGCCGEQTIASPQGRGMSNGGMGKGGHQGLLPSWKVIPCSPPDYFKSNKL